MKENNKDQFQDLEKLLSEYANIRSEERLQNKKYFYPSLDELFVGYECELGGYTTKSGGKETWQKEILDEISVKGSRNNKTPEGIMTISRLVEIQSIRTKYLDKEDIEKEGWEELEGNKFKKNNYYLMLTELSHSPERITRLLQIWREFPQIDSLERRVIYSYIGDFQSINEFRKICKWLNIK